MSDPFIAEIRVMPYNFAPRGWARCDGQLMPIQQNTALFSLLGTNFGGDGRATFGLPNLQDRFAMGTGMGPGLSDRVIGEATGQAAVTLTTSEMPAHSHTLMAGLTPNATSPTGAVMSPTASGGGNVYRAPGALAAMAAGTVSTTGGNQPHNNRQPFLGLQFCIALQGIFPPRG
ncbi:MAG: phage tail protein [Roseateles sp.]